MSRNLKALIEKLNPTTRKVMEAAAGFCVARTHYDIEIEHFLLKLLDSPDCDFQKIMMHFNLERSRIEHQLQRSLDNFKAGNPKSPAFSRYLIDALSKAWLCSSLDYDSQAIRTGFLIVAMLSDDGLSKLLFDSCTEFTKINAEELQTRFFGIVKGSVEDPPVDDPRKVSATRALSGGPHVFLSYRHEDSGLYAEFLFSQLGFQIPDIQIFRDEDTLTPGILFAEKIDEAVDYCDVLIAIIGEKWLGKEGDKRRIDSENDWVRREVATALKKNKLVIPCLVGGAKLPKLEELPPDLVGLTARHTVSLDQKGLRQDTAALISRLKNWERSF
jgi:hypothetical protein